MSTSIENFTNIEDSSRRYQSAAVVDFFSGVDGNYSAIVFFFLDVIVKYGEQSLYWSHIIRSQHGCSLRHSSIY